MTFALLEMSGIVVPPLAGAMRAACRRDAKLGKRIYRLLTFGNEDRLLIGDGFEQRGQAIERAFYVAEFPAPSAIAVRSALRKSLWRKPHDLKQQFAGLVAVVIFRDDSASGAIGFGFAVPRRKPKLRPHMILARPNVVTGMTENNKSPCRQA